ncbi:MAG: COX15/CtaA family protein [Gammaproteobacteria bacterium]
MNPPAVASTTGTALKSHDRQLALWLMLCCAMVFAMVVLGGVTRLTGSGLSMVEWDPIFGIVPPLSEAQWNATFDLYRESPEYRKINAGMDLHGFKQIYWFEFAHRLLGRTIGVVFLIPFLYFLFAGRIRRPLIPRLATLFVLGGLQGVLGWYMVKSGLVDKPHVSQYRLTAHLAAALLIYAYMLWVALGLWTNADRAAASPAPRGLRRFAALLGGLVFITALSGGFVAGLKAGFAYNTFPLMDGHWIPETMFQMSPVWRNFFENIATVQFDHRLLATLVFVGCVSFWLAARRQTLPVSARIGVYALLAAVVLQVTLGISTLLLHVPTALAATHQAGALLLLTVVLFVNHRLIYARD